MSLYQTPIRPYDPVIQDVAGGSRYLRDNFSHTGQDSFTSPPAQDQSLWTALTNIMPITRGNLQRRWGYSAFATGLSSGANRIYSYQRDTDGLRTLVTTGGSVIQAFTEYGTVLNSAVFTPVRPNPIRMVNSRSYAYFFNGYLPDQVKWDGDGNISNIGISANAVTTGSSFGPNLPGTAADRADHSHAWTNPNNIKLQDGSSATCTVAAGSTTGTNTLRASNFSLATTGSSVTGIQVDVKLSVNKSTPVTLTLVKNNGVGSGVEYGSSKTVTVSNTSLATVSFGGADDLWGGLFTTGDTQSTLFGVDLSAPTSTAPGVVSGITLNSQGSGWPTSSIPVTLSGGGGTGATAHANSALDSDYPLGHPTYHVTSVTVTNGGTGYTSAPTVSFSGGGGGASATAHINAGGTSLTVNVDSVKITVFVVPGSGIVVGAPAAGNVNLTIGRVYYQAFKNSITGHYSNISPASTSTGPATNKEFPLTLSLNNDSQVDTNVILATADGGDPSILYLVAEVPASTTSYTDNTTEVDLTNSQTLVFTDDFGNETGITDNDPPQAGTYVLKHQGRLWMLVGQNLFFSKSVAELTMPNGFIAGKYEEAWPAENYFDISEGAETGTGLLSDGVNLYIGTQSHVRVLVGNDPTNFVEPTIVHPTTGVLSQEVWQLVYLEGAPAGSIWLTPDFRVIGSDFNTYYDIGTPIQNILNNIQPSAATLAHSMMVQDGEFDLYILAIPVASSTVCDTHLVYDMRQKRWFVWQPNDASLGAVFNITANGAPQWLFTDGNSIFQYTPSSSTDNGTAINEVAETSWLHLGEPTTRKLLDEIEVIGDPAMTVAALGASTQGEFLNPLALTGNITPVVSPLGQLKVYLASRPCRHRFYKFRFLSSSGATDFLDGYSIRSVPFHTI